MIGFRNDPLASPDFDAEPLVSPVTIHPYILYASQKFPGIDRSNCPPGINPLISRSYPMATLTYTVSNGGALGNPCRFANTTKARSTRPSFSPAT